MMQPARTIPTSRPLLSIIIPALNEEDAIGSTIQRCLDAEEKIRSEGGVSGLEVIVVSDGSTDRTAEIAREFEGVSVFVFPENRGYGAAIKHGFDNASGDLLAFLDADGTCDPVYFGALSRELTTDEADISLGSRMGADSQMPKIRTLGNRLFAVLLGMLSNQSVSDTASGMRVIRRSALDALGPLPDGLHYTPAMSARALLGGLRIREVPMTYSERIGHSKLSVVSDGKRFLSAILDGVLFYRPARAFMIASLTLLVLASLVSLNPVEHYLTLRFIEPWMIYRFVLAFLLGSMGVTALGAAALASRLASLVGVEKHKSFWGKVIEFLFSGRFAFWFFASLVTGSVLLVFPGLAEYARYRTISIHWSRVIVAAFALLVAFQIVLTSVLLRIMQYWIRVAEFREGSPEPSQRAE
jgi:glycosyltransferase involved in cell wall biosynthesis